MWIEGTRVTFDPPFKRNVGMVFQNYALFPHMTVADNLAFPLRMRKLPVATIRDRVARGLALVQLEGLGSRYPRQLSGGQQQRVAMARALVFEPPVLLMDEPLGALDKQLRLEMQLELKHLQARLGVTVIYVTHDQEEALTLSDRVAVMNRGRVEQFGEPTELYDTPASEFVARFVGESNRLDGVIGAGEDGGHELITRSGLRVPVRSGGAAMGEAAVLFLRPERIALGLEASAGAPPTGPAAAGPAVAGEVVEAVFVGEATRYVVRATAGETFTVKRLNLDAADRLKVGARVTLRWDPDAAFIQRRDP